MDELTSMIAFRFPSFLTFTLSSALTVYFFAFSTVCLLEKEIHIFTCET